MYPYITECPNCNSHTIEYDDRYEWAFCPFCEHKFLIRNQDEYIYEKRMACKYRNLADHAFVFGNYSEAYAYYLKSLEYDDDNYLIYFRKSCCDAILHPNLISGFTQITKTAYKQLSSLQSDWDKKYCEITQDLLTFIKDRFQALTKRKKSFLSVPTTNEIETYYKEIKSLTELHVLSIDAVTNEALTRYPHLETFFKELLTSALEISKAGITKFKYYTGDRVFNYNKETHYRQSVYKRSKPMYFKYQLKQYEKFIDRYNTLPTTKNGLASLDKNIQFHTEIIDEFKKEKTEYFTQHPSEQSAYENKNACLCIAATILLGLFAVLGNFPFPIIRQFYLILTVFFSIKAFRQYEIEQAQRKTVIESFPSSLKELITKYEQSTQELQVLKKERKVYVQQNILTPAYPTGSFKMLYYFAHRNAQQCN